MVNVAISAGCALAPAGPSSQAHCSSAQSVYRKRNSDPNIFAVPPSPPSEETAEGWTRFLRAYRTGRWKVRGTSTSEDSQDEEDNDEEVLAVNDIHGCSMSSQEYFKTYKHLAAPRLSPARRRMRHEVLLRHGLTHAHLRPNLQRYVELAKRLFACDMVTLSFASADESHIIFVAAEGPPLTQVPQCASICSHALLLQGESDIFLVPDMAKDWRFEHLFDEQGPHANLGYRFHASAPIFLSSSETPCCNVPLAPLHAGRFSIFSTKPRPEFNAEDCRLLLNLARMTEEGIEHEFLASYVSKARLLQHDTAEIFRSLDQFAEDRTDIRTTAQTAATAIESASDQYAGPSRPRVRRNPTTTAPSTVTKMADDEEEQGNILCDARVMGQIVRMMRQSLDASTVCIVDASDVDNAPPFLDWIAAHRKGSNGTNGKKVSKLFDIPRRDSREGSTAVKMTALSGDVTLAPRLNDNTSLSQLQSCFDFVLARGRQGLPQLFRRSMFSDEVQDLALKGQCPFHIHDDQSSTVQCCCSMLGGDMRNLILPLLPDRALSAFVIPIFANDVVAQKRTPLAMVFAIWDVECAINMGEIDFCTTVGIQLASIAIRDQANKIRRGQMDFLRTMQHELRTPLNGITCISEALCDRVDESSDLTSTGDGKGWLTQSVGSGRNGSSINRTLLEQLSTIEDKNTSSFSQVIQKAAVVLAPQLESIHISGLMLKTILDDILSFDTIFQTPGTSFSQKMLQSNAGKQINLVDLGHEIEDVCREELRFFALQSLRTFRATNGATPTTPLDVAEQQQQPHLNGSATTTFSDAVKTARETLTNGADGAANGGEEANSMTLPATLLIFVDPSLKRQYRSDRLKLRRIVGKLVSNALRYTPPTGLIEVHIQPSSSEAAAANAERSQRQGVKPYSPSSHDSVSTDSDQTTRAGDDAHTWISIVVKDSGIGMSDAFVTQKYLQPFHKADQFGQGVGLGATVACIMVQSLGGSFFVQSDTDKGTEVSVFLPVAAVDEDVELAAALHEKLKLVKKAEKQLSVRFVGFEHVEGHVALRSALEDHLVGKRGFVVLDEDSAASAANLVIIHESVLDNAAVRLPRELGSSGTYAIIVSQNPTNLQSEAECMQLISQSPYAYFRPPYGPSATSRLGELLDAMSSSSRAPNGRENGKNGARPSAAPRRASTKTEHVQDIFDREQDRNGSVDLKDTVRIATSLSTASITTDGGDQTQAEDHLVKEIGETVVVLPSDATDDQDAFRVLVVEDNPINMRLIVSLLRKLKLNYVEAHDGVEAVEQYKLFRPSLVLLDISLPLMDGFGACLAMRAHILPFRPKIIAITALSTEEDKLRGITVCGMDDWQTKPISIRMLRTNLGKWREEWDIAQRGTLTCSQQALDLQVAKSAPLVDPLTRIDAKKSVLIE
jgi:signal transduction histidine kinase/CheY-like chemotaxis protein